MAHRAGIWSGQPLATARTHCPEGLDVTVPEDAARALDPAWRLLAEACPIIEPDPDGHLQAFGAWPTGGPPLPELRALMARAREAFPMADLAVGLGGNRLVARLCCPAETGFAVVAPGGERRFMADQPIAALAPLPPRLPHRLAVLGIRRCGQLLEIPPATLRARLGGEAVSLRPRCAGQDSEPVRALYPPRVLRARATFPDGLPPGAWSDAVTELSGQAGASLGRGEGVGCLHLWIDGAEHTRRWTAPQRQADRIRHAARQLALQAGTSATACAEVFELELGDLAVVPITPRLLWSPQPGEREQARLEPLFDRFPARLLRRGAPEPDRHEAMLALLDPWRAQRQGGGRPVDQLYLRASTSVIYCRHET